MIEKKPGTRVHTKCEQQYDLQQEIYRKQEKDRKIKEEQIQNKPIQDDEKIYKGDEHYYLIATEELDSGEIDKAMWTKAMTKSQGNEEQARYRYVELKVESLKKGLKYQNKQELITKATRYGKKGGKAIGIVIAIYLFIVLIFLIIYVFPNL